MSENEIITLMMNGAILAVGVVIGLSVLAAIVGAILTVFVGALTSIVAIVALCGEALKYLMSLPKRRRVYVAKQKAGIIEAEKDNALNHVRSGARLVRSVTTPDAKYYVYVKSGKKTTVMTRRGEQHIGWMLCKRYGTPWFYETVA